VCLRVDLLCLRVSELQGVSEFTLVSVQGGIIVNNDRVSQNLWLRGVGSFLRDSLSEEIGQRKRTNQQKVIINSGTPGLKMNICLCVCLFELYAWPNRSSDCYETF
jgi:hypothetical protein